MLVTIKLLALLVAMMAIFSVNGNEMTKTPNAKIEKVIFHEQDHEREDPYRWLNKRDTEEVLAYLKGENEFTDHSMQITQHLQNELYEEFKNRFKEDDSSVPVLDGSYFYYTRYEKGKTYPIYCRKKNIQGAREEIILDVNEEAKSHDYYNVDTIKISPNEKLIAFAEDLQGRRIYNIKIKDLSTGHEIDNLPNVTSNFEWANDSHTLLYAQHDPISLRSYRIYHHSLGLPKNQDILKYEEKDDTYDCEISKTKSKQYLMIGSFKKDSTEFRFVEANRPEQPFEVFTPRQDGHEYYVEHQQNRFIIRTNAKVPNFEIMQCPLDRTHFKYWAAFIPYREDVYIENIEVFDTFLALEQRDKGLTQIKIHPFNQAEPYVIAFDEPDYVASLDENPEMSSHLLRLNYCSLKTPETIYDFDIKTKHKILKKQDEIQGFDPNLYQTHKIFAIARDGAEIPISLIYRKSKFKLNKNPLLLTGYGSYGVSFDATFNPFIISLLDRGFVYAIAQIRGGSDLGRNWYFQGKLLHKKNTFTDFITAAEHLEKEGFASIDRKYAVGRSAGGLLMGAVMNMRPSLFKGVIAHVPFVDLMNTMMDPSIPLTTSEYAEWGDPHDKIYYDYMLSYSPYDNVQPMAYPNLLVIAAYQDSQVQYWEAAKWVAKLRANKTDNNILLLRTMMNASHSGASGRYERYREKAFEYAFLLNLENQAGIG